MTPELIEWVDSFGAGATWTEIADIDKDVEMRCSSVGYVLKETEQYVIVVPHIHGDLVVEGLNKKITASGCGEMAIPKVSIVKRVALKEEEHEESPAVATAD